jgi:hypothetical protein
MGFTGGFKWILHESISHAGVENEDAMMVSMRVMRLSLLD